MAIASSSESSTVEYRFGSFRLAPRAHELWRGDELIHAPRLMFDCLAYLIENRDRVVGLDELVSAVWGRVDVADAQVRQLIARVRALVDDNATNQRAIRTLPGVGYRWVIATETGAPSAGLVEAVPVFPAIDRLAHNFEVSQSEASADAANGDAPASPLGAKAQTELVQAPMLQRSSRVSIALAILVVLAFVLFRNFAGFKEAAGPPAASTGPAQALVVLPLDVSGPDEVAWVRLGAMDLIANRLRSDGLPVPPSESVVSAVHAAGEPLDADRLTKLQQTLGASALVQGSVTTSPSGWKVDLVTTTPDGLRHTSEAERPDVTDAARQAADLLLASLGHSPPSDKGDKGDDLQEILQRAQAALLANQLDAARSILLGASAGLQGNPHIRFKLAQLYQRAGGQDQAAIALKSLLDDPDVNARPTLHAQILNLIATIAFRRQDCVGSERSSGEAVNLLRDQAQPGELGQALTTRALANVCTDHFDRAVDDLGSARIQAVAAGDRLGIAGVDHVMGALEVQRNRPGEAIPYFAAADDVFAAIGAVEPMIANLTGLYYAQVALLRRTDALATSERLWTMHDRTIDPGRRMYLGVIRSGALTATGRYTEAEVVLAGLRDAEKGLPATEARLLYAARAELDSARGLPDQALMEADQALASFLDRAGPEDGERASLLLLRQRASLAAGKPALAEPPPWMTGKLSTSALLIAEAEWFAHQGQVEEADRAFQDSGTAAEADGVPEQIALAANAYGDWLLVQHRVGQAASQAGRVALWANQDFDSALLQAAVLHALGQLDAWAKALKQAHTLAGERKIPDALQAPPAQ